MKSLPPLWRWLAWAALADWLITRLVSRAAIHIPKTAWLIALYQGLTGFGQWASTLAALLSFVTLGWLCWHMRRHWGAAALWGGLLLFQVGFLFVPPAGWAAVGYHLLLLSLLGWLGVGGWRVASGWMMRGVISLVVFSLGAGVLYQMLPALYTAWQWPGPAPLTLELFNLGEGGVVLTPLALAFALRRTGTRRALALALIPTSLFVAAHLVNPSMTAILAIWSTGLTLYLPWPLYALSLYAASAVVFAAWERDQAPGWALLLLAAGGYAPQLGTQLAFALLGLWLLGQAPPVVVVPENTTINEDWRNGALAPFKNAPIL